MRIVVLVKHVPEPSEAWRFTEHLTIDRACAEGRLSALDEYAVEQALRIGEAGQSVEITYLTMGPAPAVEALRKAMSMGGDQGVHVLDDALAGTDAAATSLVLAKALQRLGFDLVLTGMSSTDAEMSVVPSMIADRLEIPQATYASLLTIDGASARVHRTTDTCVEEIVVALPTVISVTDRSGEPRYASFKGIMAARKKPVQTWTLKDIGVDANQVGLAAAGTVVDEVHAALPRMAGTVIVDEGDAAVRLTEFLVAAKAI